MKLKYVISEYLNFSFVGTRGSYNSYEDAKKEMDQIIKDNEYSEFHRLYKFKYKIEVHLDDEISKIASIYVINKTIGFIYDDSLTLEFELKLFDDLSYSIEKIFSSNKGVFTSEYKENEKRYIVKNDKMFKEYTDLLNGLKTKYEGDNNG